MKKKFFAVTTIVIFLAAWTELAEASFAITHSGSTDPATEGFGVWPWSNSANVQPVQNDMGYAAWSITGLAQGQQYVYYSTPLSSNQLTDIANQGFVLNVKERVVQGNAPIYDAANPAVIGVVALSTGSKRFDIDLGVNSAGNTVVVLPNYVTVSGGIGITPGASYTLTDSGSSYHTYQLTYNPTTQLSDLFVDGIERIQGYSGFSYYSPDEGNSRGLYSLLWGGYNGGQANFNTVQFASSPVPIPSAVWLFGSALASLFGFSRRKTLTV
jgi:hypothetical protein